MKTLKMIGPLKTQGHFENSIGENLTGYMTYFIADQCY